ncbi:MAG: DUF6496 domain-containing protein, partial [Gammaproteobacteria bacterium]
VAIGLSEARKAGAKVPPPEPKTSASTRAKSKASPKSFLIHTD